MQSTTQAVRTEPGFTMFLNAVRKQAVAGDDPRLEIIVRALQSLARRVAAPKNGAQVRPSDLAQEAYLELFHRNDADPKMWTDREHFRAAAAATMRHLLVDHVRRKGARKRGGGRQQLDLEVLAERVGIESNQLSELDDALDHLQRLCSPAATIIQLHVFGGMALAEIAEAMGLSITKVRELQEYGRARVALDLRG